MSERRRTTKWSRRTLRLVPSCRRGARLIWRVRPLMEASSMNATLSLLGLPLSGARHRFVRHPFYGKCRVVRRPSSGSSKEHWMYDPDYEPELPPGAVRGDVSKQVFCSACHVPKYFYVDEQSQCLQCGRSFTFGATEQKYWYETLKFNFHSAAVRCPDCRRLRRSERALREQIAHGRAAITSAPDDPAPFGSRPSAGGIPRAHGPGET